MDDLSTENSASVVEILTRLTELVTASSSRQVSAVDCHPEAIFSKWQLQAHYRVSSNRISEATKIVESHPEAIENGDNTMAPLRVWCEAMRQVPKNPRPYQPKKRR